MWPINISVTFQCIYGKILLQLHWSIDIRMFSSSANVLKVNQYLFHHFGHFHIYISDKVAINVIPSFLTFLNPHKNCGLCNIPSSFIVQYWFSFIKIYCCERNWIKIIWLCSIHDCHISLYMTPPPPCTKTVTYLTKKKAVKLLLYPTHTCFGIYTVHPTALF
jgi:hypothetical protein